MLERYPADQDARDAYEDARSEAEQLVEKGAVYSALAAQRLGIRK